MTDTSPCLVCDKELKNCMGSESFQPNGGVMLTCTGNYGSTVFDPIEGGRSYFEMYLCDQCLVDKIKAGKVTTVNIERITNVIERVSREEDLLN